MAPWIEIAGWTLLHFVWQGTAIAVVAAAGLRLQRTAEPHVRYALASAALLAMLIAPLATAARLSASASVRADSPFAISRSLLPAIESRAFFSERLASAVPAVRPSAFGDVLPAIVMMWLAGVALLQLRLWGGWWHVRGLHRIALAASPCAWQARAGLLGTRLGVRRPVHVAEVCEVGIPSVIGLWRPVILLPIGALAGLTPAQADAILVHELAHIRRHDYLFNGLQHVVETLLFYHPAVWWVSRRMRIEREHCCDAVVVRVCGDPIDYAVALVELEGGRGSRTRLAVAATDGPLMRRIRVLLSVQPSHRRPLAHSVVTLSVVTVLVLVASGGYRWTVRASVDPAPRAQQTAQGAEAVVVTVNGEAITDRDLGRLQKFFKRDQPDGSLAAVLAAAVDERLAVQRGRQLGYSLSDDQFRSVLANVMAQNNLTTDDALQDALAKEQLTLADLRRNFESQTIVSRLQLNIPRAPIADDEAREYFNTHLDAFPLQTFELARPRIDELLQAEHRGRDWRRYLETLRATAVLLWQRPDLQRAYEAFRNQNPQGRADVPLPSPAAASTPEWRTYATIHFDIFTNASNAEVQRVDRDAEQAYQRLSADLKHDLAERLNLVVFATGVERDRAVERGSTPGSGSRILLALDRPDERFQADVVHEITHEFEFDILPAPVLTTSPAWIPEGLAEYEGEVWTTGDDELLRGLVRTDRVPSLSAFETSTERRLPYAVGHAAFDFIAARWGMDGIRRMLFTLRQRQAADRGGLYPTAFGVSAEEFDQAFERYLRDRFPL